MIAGIRSSHLCLSAVVPALRRTGHPFAVSGLSTFTEDYVCVLCQSRNNPRESREIALRCPVGYLQDLAVCALCIPGFFPQWARSLGRRCALICRHECPLPAIYGQ
jgi:hypothetical protein